jgi:hypothetical protein
MKAMGRSALGDAFEVELKALGSEGKRPCENAAIFTARGRRIAPGRLGPTLVSNGDSAGATIWSEFVRTAIHSGWMKGRREARLSNDARAQRASPN